LHGAGPPGIRVPPTRKERSPAGWPIFPLRGFSAEPLLFPWAVFCFGVLRSHFLTGHFFSSTAWWPRVSPLPLHPLLMAAGFLGVRLGDRRFLQNTSPGFFFPRIFFTSSLFSNTPDFVLWMPSFDRGPFRTHCHARRRSYTGIFFPGPNGHSCARPPVGFLGHLIPRAWHMLWCPHPPQVFFPALPPSPFWLSFWH